jgi:hypothetical protein
MNAEPFLKPRLTGARFEGHAIPLEFLKDLAVLEEMIIDVAKWKFMEEHPDRQRVPRGFTDGIGLKLIGVEEGSAVPVIILSIASLTLFPQANQIFYEKARDSFVCAIEAAEQNQPITEYLPERTLNYFDRIGRSLRDDEAIEFITPAQARPARLTKETRRKLVLASATTQEYTEDVSIRGMIPEADQGNMRFEIQLIDGRKIKAPLTIEHLDDVITGFKGYKSGSRVQLSGVGKFSRQNRLQGFESIESISILDPLDIPARIDDLRELKDGWLEDKGKAPDPAGLDWLSLAFERNYPDDLPLPFIYPTPEGGIQAEWTIEPNEISLEIDIAAHTGKWHRLDTKTSLDETRDLGLDDPNGWEWISDQIRSMTGGDA